MSCGPREYGGGGKLFNTELRDTSLRGMVPPAL